MKNIFAVLAMAATVATLLVQGCEDDDGEGGGGYQERATVQTKSHTPEGLSFGTDSGWNVRVGESTTVMKQRPSCSGFDTGSGEDVEIGNVIEFDVRDEYSTYYPDKATTPSRIVAYRQECLAEENPNVIVVPCQPCQSCSSDQ